MYQVFGLPRDPFGPACDGDLFWESEARAAVRGSALELLRQGRGVWLSGPPGSGRSALLSRLAEELAADGRPVLQAELVVSPSAEAFLAGLFQAVDEGPLPPGLLPVASELYRRLLDARCTRGPAPCFPGQVSASPDVIAELEILGGLRLLGEPLVALALAGSGESPLADAQTVKLPAPLSSDLRDCLSRRLEVCGGAGLLSPEALEAIGDRAGSFGEALAQGRRALSRAAFRRSLGTPGQAPPLSAQQPASLFDPAELDEVARLLDSLGPESPAP